MDDYSFNPDLEARDEGFLFMQNFHTQMNELAREVLILPQLNICWSFLPPRSIQTRLSFGL